MKRKLLLIIFLCFSASFYAEAQNRTITGTVTAKEDGLPIPGATVKEKNSNVDTQTNTAGKFTLSVPTGGSIVVSFVGFTTQTVVVGTQNVVNVALSANSTS